MLPFFANANIQRPLLRFAGCTYDMYASVYLCTLLPFTRMAIYSVLYRTLLAYTMHICPFPCVQCSLLHSIGPSILHFTQMMIYRPLLRFADYTWHMCVHIYVYDAPFHTIQMFYGDSCCALLAMRYDMSVSIRLFTLLICALPVSPISYLLPSQIPAMRYRYHTKWVQSFHKSSALHIVAMRVP